MLFDFFIKTSLDFEILYYSFNDQIAVFELGQIVFKVSYCDEGSAIGCEKGRGL